METNNKHIYLEKMSQVVILITGVLAVWLVNSSNTELRFMAALLGILGQPFWFYSTYMAKQWGMFISCFFFSGAWIYGVVNYMRV